MIGTRPIAAIRRNTPIALLTASSSQLPVVRRPLSEMIGETSAWHSLCPRGHPESLELLAEFVTTGWLQSGCCGIVRARDCAVWCFIRCADRARAQLIKYWIEHASLVVPVGNSCYPGNSRIATGSLAVGSPTVNSRAAAHALINFTRAGVLQRHSAHTARRHRDVCRTTSRERLPCLMLENASSIFLRVLLLHFSSA
jgi:hypothetical protein